MEDFTPKKITQEDIEKFIDGRDPEERIVNLTYKYQDDFISVIFRDKDDVKRIRKDPFYPFVWATRAACERLCDGDREEVKRQLKKFHIGVKKLTQKDTNGVVRHEFDDGYLFKFYAKTPMSYSTFLKFFKTCHNPVFSDKKEKEYEDIRSLAESKQYLTVTPQEQYLIATGKRFFKGYDDYDEVLKMTFDLETTGLKKDVDRILKIGIKFNRPFPGHPNGFEKIIQASVGNTDKEKDASESWAIVQLFKIIYTFQPDIITAHNGENFDWDMIIHACDRLGMPIAESSAKYFKGDFIRKEERESTLKLGGETEKFHKTIVPGIIVTDSLHAVRRAQALDSNMLKADLKYVTAYSKMKKKNRVYIPGDKIAETETDYEHQFAFCDENGDWYRYDPDYKESPKPEIVPEHDLQYFKDQIEKINSKEPTREEYAELYEPEGYTWEEYVDEVEDEKYPEDVTAESLYNEYLESLKPKNSGVLVPGRTCNTLRPGYELKTGRYIVDRYLFDDLWECEKVEHRYNTPNFLICKMIPVPYAKCTTMGTAGQWKAMMLAWSYENDLAIPMFKEKKRFTGGLSRLLRTGYVRNVVKLDYNSLYPSIILTWGIYDPTDLMMAMLHFLNHVLTQREKYKNLKKVAHNKKEAATNEDERRKYAYEESFNDKKQLPLKIFGNSFFGSYGAPNVFPHGSVKCAEWTTCIGRMALRLMISHFKKLGYEPIVGDTDGFNFALPEESMYRYTDEHPYVSPGLSRETKAGKSYTGFRADVAEFNDVYMCDHHYAPNAVNKMGLGIDEVVTSTINFSRKNYADYFPENPYPEDVKLVGNTIKSKKMPEYIAKFLAKGIRLLLKGDGHGFLEEYYAYVRKIYDYQIPLRDIASKGKIKKSIKEYLHDVKQLTKAGREKSRQAWYELAIQNNLSVDNGDTIYYVNTGSAKSHSDIKKTKKFCKYDLYGDKCDITKEVEKEYRAWKKSAKENPAECQKKFGVGPGDVGIDLYVKKTHQDYFSETEIIMNCVLVPRDIIDKEGDTFCSDVDESLEYNVQKYIDMFNKRIKPLLVCFSKEIRNQILVENPKDIPYFTDEQCQLVSGEPNKPGDEDTYEQIMTMEDKEIKFWYTYEMVPPFVEECGMGKWKDIVEDYLRRMKEEEENGIKAEKEEYRKAIEKMTNEEIENFMEEGELPPSLLKIIDIDVDSTNFISKVHEGAVIGNIDDIIEIAESREIEDDDDE